MSSRAQNFPMMAKPADGHGSGGGTRGDSTGRDEQSSYDRDGDAASPPPLPADPRVRARILADIERGLSQAQAGLGDDLEDVLAEMDRKIAAHR
jgi:hypothetical protein